MRFRAGVMLCLLLGVGLWLQPTASAVWEHSRVSEATRLPAGQEVWEFSLVYTLDAMYPARFTCPGGVRVVFHLLNLSPLTLRVERPGSRETFALAPGAYRKWDFGPVPPGDHEFNLVLPLDSDASHSHGKPEVPGRMRCRLSADTWPGDTLPYEAVWIAAGGRLLPSRLALPAGRPVALFLGAARQARRERFTVQDQLLEIKPGEVSLTEWRRPRGEKASLPLPPAQPAVLEIR